MEEEAGAAMFASTDIRERDKFTVVKSKPKLVKNIKKYWNLRLRTIVTNMYKNIELILIFNKSKSVASFVSIYKWLEFFSAEATQHPQFLKIFKLKYGMNDHLVDNAEKMSNGNFAFLFEPCKFISISALFDLNLYILGSVEWLAVR